MSNAYSFYSSLEGKIFDLLNSVVCINCKNCVSLKVAKMGVYQVSPCGYC